MKLYKLGAMKDGWFAGDFSPAAYKTKTFEVAWKVHKKNEDWSRHYQKEATEINLLVRGQMLLEAESGEAICVSAGDIFIIEPGEAIKPKFIEDCEVVCVKTPSLPDDKVVCK